MWQTPLLLDKYKYAKTNPYLIRIIGILGIATTLLMAFGFWRYFQLGTFYLIVFGPIAFLFVANKLSRFVLQLFYQKFDIKKHEKFISDFWASNSEPSVDIFLPYAGEELEVHEEVVKAASQLDYKNYRVYMLDDAGSTEHRKLAEKYGCVYLSRPNKGEFKKSGNLEYGYIHSDGEFIFILDADFIPTADCLFDLVPYIVKDRQIGILQTPQYFEQTKRVHKRSQIEFGGGNIVEDFYRVTMPCRDEFKAAMCVGTSAIYRRSAIAELDGTPKVHASEDLATGLLITQFGFYVKYLPLIVSMGTSPETYQGYFKQHLRWCSGNLVFAQYWPAANLNLMGRLIYMINPMYYVSEALSVVFSFQFLILLYFHADTLSLSNSLYFLPYLVLNSVIIPLTKINKGKVGTRFAALSNAYTYFYTYIRMLTNGVPAWHPTGVKIKGLHGDFVSAFNIGTAISGVYIVLFLFVIISRPFVFGNYDTYAVLMWSFYSAFWHVMFLYLVLRYMHPFTLENMKGWVGKTFVYSKTHMLPFLFSALLGAAFVNSIFALRDDNAPTVLAFSRLMNLEEQPVDAIASEEIEDTSRVLAATTEDIGDNISLEQSLEMVEEYCRNNNISLTENQTIYAASKLMNEEDILRVIEEAAKWN
jgi:cellulose synthase (UDP-forming)